MKGDCGWAEESVPFLLPCGVKAAVLVVSDNVFFPIEKAAWWHGYCSLFVSLCC